MVHRKRKFQMSGTTINILFFNFTLIFAPNVVNLTEIATKCTESGIWQPIDFSCNFDPLAVNLKDGSNFGKKSFIHSY